MSYRDGGAAERATALRETVVERRAALARVVSGRSRIRRELVSGALAAGGAAGVAGAWLGAVAWLATGRVAPFVAAIALAFALGAGRAWWRTRRAHESCPRMDGSRPSHHGEAHASQRSHPSRTRLRRV